MLPIQQPIVSLPREASLKLLIDLPPLSNELAQLGEIHPPLHHDVRLLLVCEADHFLHTKRQPFSSVIPCHVHTRKNVVRNL